MAQDIHAVLRVGLAVEVEGEGEGEVLVPVPVESLAAADGLEVPVPVPVESLAAADGVEVPVPAAAEVPVPEVPMTLLLSSLRNYPMRKRH